jgi:hypothetical protein
MAERLDSHKPAEEASKKSKKQLTRNEKIRDFLIGFMSWWIISGLVWRNECQLYCSFSNLE